MKRTLKVGPDGNLTDSGGTSYGRLLSITLDIDEPVGPLEKGAVVGEQQELLGNTANACDAGARVTGEAEPAEDLPLKVWEVYVEEMNPRRKELDPQQRAVIRDALKVATADECIRAIRGCKSSGFHMGENDRRKKYNAISQILRGKQGRKTTREQIDMFLEIADKSGVQSRVLSEPPEKVRQAKRDVYDWFDFPGDDHAVTKGKVALEYLEGIGFSFDWTTRKFTEPE